MALRHPVVALVCAVVIAASLLVAVQLAAPEADAPPDIRRMLPEAKHTLSSQLELFAHLRYVGAEIRERDDLVILKFELRPFPFVHAEGAYLASRCVAVDKLDSWAMSGGRGVTDFETDIELASLRSDAQPDCS